MSDKPARAVKLNVLNEPKDSYTCLLYTSDAADEE
mgnify:FL=1